MRPSLPCSFSREDLEAAGFVGWRTWDELPASDFHAVPDDPAAYVVFRPSVSEPAFRRDSLGGHFKGRNPTVDPAVLEHNWVPNVHVVYIGKADAAKRRLKQFARFGAAEPVGHWGGRYIWQLADARALLVAWHVITWGERARDYEKRLLAHFARLPTAAVPSPTRAANLRAAVLLVGAGGILLLAHCGRTRLSAERHSRSARRATIARQSTPDFCG